MPRFVIVGGPNGCGKTTLTRSLRYDYPILNPDEIAKEGHTIIAAGRETFVRLERCLDAGQSCVLETTLSGNWHFAMIARARRSRMNVELHFVAVESAAISGARVQDRVAKGGHDIAPTDQARRFPKSLRNAPRTARLCDVAYFYDNTAGLREKFGPACVIRPSPLRVERFDPAPAGWMVELIDATIREIQEGLVCPLTGGRKLGIEGRRGGRPGR